MDFNITSHMRQYGITNNLLRATKMIHCPRCGYEFNLMYGRAVACVGCSSVVKSCDKARCPKCDHSFPIRQAALVETKQQEIVL